MNRPNTMAATIITGMVPTPKGQFHGEVAQGHDAPHDQNQPAEQFSQVTVKMSWMVAMSAEIRLLRSPTRRAS